MGNRNGHFRKKVIAALYVPVLAAMLFVFDGVRALAAPSGYHGFGIDAEMLSGSNSGTYDVLLEVLNTGDNFEGTVRLIAEDSYYATCAYDTAVSLPQGSKKQFTVQIPTESMMLNGNRTGAVYVQVLNKKGTVLAQETFPKLLTKGQRSLSMGILSDHYNSLTYLDMGGDLLYYYGEEYPVKLYELDKDTLHSMLSDLTFLVIDQYNCGALDQNQIWEIESWVDSGGVLIVGTGQYADKTLAGLDNFIYVEYENGVLKDLYGRYVESYSSQAYLASEGDGSVCVLPYTLAEAGKTADSSRQFAYQLLNECADMGRQRYNYNSYDRRLNYMGPRLFGIFSNSNSSLNFTVLDLIVVFYVFLAGPILYLILRAMKKREMYWLAVPAASLFFIIIIYFAGKGFQVTNARVFSISIARADGRGDVQTYLNCYNAGHDEWSLKMQDNYNCAGQAFFEQNNSDDPLRYYHHIKTDGKGFSIGANPNATFEDVYFYAMGSNPNRGSINTKGIYSDGKQSVGQIVNNTGRDFINVAVAYDGNFALYGALPAGETMYLDGQKPIYSNTRVDSTDSFASGYMYGVLRDTYRKRKNMEESSRLAAMGIGVALLYGDHTDFVVGLVEDYDKTIDDDCYEVSYGCLYSTGK